LENFIISINCVIPVFMMICTGALIRKIYNVPKQVFDQLSTMCFQVLLPFMLFDNIYSTDLSQAFDLHLVVFLLVAIVIWFTIGYILFTLLSPTPAHAAHIFRRFTDPTSAWSEWLWPAL